MSAATNALAEIKEALLIEAVQVRAKKEGPSEIERAIKEIRKFTEVVADVINRPDSEPTILPLEVSSPEMAEILKEMRRLSSTAVAILDRPAPGALQVHPAPVVHVDAPTVQLSPTINVERANVSYRVRVIKRDPASRLIQELTIEPIP